MTNAKKELMEAISNRGKSLEDIIAYKIIFHEWYDREIVKTIDELDFEYDSGYGSQMLYGIVLFNDNSWLERSEYDGSEWWTYISVPTIEDVSNFQ